MDIAGRRLLEQAIARTEREVSDPWGLMGLNGYGIRATGSASLWTANRLSREAEARLERLRTLADAEAIESLKRRYPLTARQS